MTPKEYQRLTKKVFTTFATIKQPNGGYCMSEEMFYRASEQLIRETAKGIIGEKENDCVLPKNRGT